MKRLLAAILSLFLVGTLAISPLWGKSHQFLLGEKARLCGVDLEPGHHKLKLSEDVAGVYKGKKLLVTARVRMEPMHNGIPNSCSCSENILREVRMDTETVIFLELIDRP